MSTESNARNRAPSGFTTKSRRLAGVLTWTLLAGLALASTAGCIVANYQTWPAGEFRPALPDEEFPAINMAPMHNVTSAALAYVARRYPPVPNPQAGVEYDQLFAVNLPKGATNGMYRVIVSRASPFARPLSRTQTEPLPTYHIARVDVRGSVADVEILRPVLTLAPGAQGSLTQNVWQGVRVRVEGGLKPWEVAWSTTFAATPADLPPLNFVEDAPK